MNSQSALMFGVSSADDIDFSWEREVILREAVFPEILGMHRLEEGFCMYVEIFREEYDIQGKRERLTPTQCYPLILGEIKGALNNEFIRWTQGKIYFSVHWLEGRILIYVNDASGQENEVFLDWGSESSASYIHRFRGRNQQPLGCWQYTYQFKVGKRL